MLSITIQNFCCRLDVEVVDRTNEEMFVDQVVNEEDSGRMTRNVPSAIVETITSCSVNNILPLNCLNEGVHPVTEKSLTYNVH